MSPHSATCVRSVSENDIARLGDTNSDSGCNEVSNNTTTSWDNLTQDSCTPKRCRYTAIDTYPPPPGILQRAPSQATMYHTTVPQSLVSRSISTRHHPTRSSLRHSRMLVMITEGRGNTALIQGSIISHLYSSSQVPARSSVSYAVRCLPVPHPALPGQPVGGAGYLEGLPAA